MRTVEDTFNSRTGSSCTKLIEKMDDPPLVSVIIPLYNKRPYILRALESVQKQSFENWELIIVDDGSTDGSTEEIPDNDPKIQLLYQENKGPGPARNYGLHKAKGKYVAFLDADDEWLPRFLETGINALEDPEAAVTVVCMGYIKYPEKIHCLEYLKNISVSEGVYEIDGRSDMKQVTSLLVFMWTSSMILHTDTVKRWGGFFDRFKCQQGEDWHLQIKLIFNERIAVIPEPYSIYHTESSDLYGGGYIKNVYPEHCILDLNDLESSCPETKKLLLDKILLRKALSVSKSISLQGQGRKAKELLHQVYPIFYADSKNVILAYIYMIASPVLPILHATWRWLKKFIYRK